jgi:cytochrome c553
VIWLAFSLACAPSQQQTPAPSTAASVKPVDQAELEAAIERGDIPDLSREMNDHYIDALRLQMAIIGGDLDGAKRMGAILAQIAEPPGLPDPTVAAPHLAAVRAAGSQAAGAGSLADAATALGQLATACGGCHQATGGGPKDEIAPPNSRETEMSLHLHGAYWLGYGLYAPSDAAWKSGLAAFATTSESAVNYGSPDSETRLHELAQAAGQVPVDQRAGAWANLLLTCAECHGPIRPR